MSFGKCGHHHHIKAPPSPQRFPCAPSLAFPTPGSQATTDLISLSTVFFRVLYTWNRLVHILLNLASFSVTFLRFIQAVGVSGVLFYSCSMIWKYLILFLHSPAGGHLGHLHLLAILNKTALKCVFMSLWGHMISSVGMGQMVNVC